MPLNFSFRACLVLVSSVLLLAGLSGCGPTEQAAGSAEPSAASGGGESVAIAPVTEATSSIGSIGGSLRLSDRIGAIYSIALREDGAWLEGAALLRGSQRGWYNEGASEAPLVLEHVGVGGSLGKHSVVVGPKAEGLWVDDWLYASLEEGNVVLFDGAGANPVKVANAAIDAYLGPAPMEDARQRKALVQERLRALLKNAASIEELWPAD